MTLLLIDTSTARCAVLVRITGEDFIDIEPGNRGQDARLAPMVQAVLAKAKTAPKDIARIAVIIGPGAFTGVRIGVAFARGLALALNKPVVGINALDVFALGNADKNYSAGVRDIGRGELAFRLCKEGVLQGRYETALVDDTVSQIRAFGGGQTVSLAGSAAKTISGDGLCDTGQYELNLSQVAELLHEGVLPERDALPWYHRPPDAKLPGGMTP